MTTTNQEKHKNINRGIYLAINVGKSFYDKKNNPEYLTVPSGAVKFGKSLDLLGINKRYKSHCGDDIETYAVAKIQDRDDIDNIEKLLHNYFDSYRLKNKNNRKVEWMEPIEIKILAQGVKDVMSNYFGITQFLNSLLINKNK